MPTDDPAAAELPLQPIPGLEQTVANARSALAPFLGGFALARTSFLLRLFGLAARKPQKRLRERTSPSARNWASEGLARYYLACRHGLPFHVSWPVLLEDDPAEPSMIARATALLAAALEIHRDLRSGAYPRDADGGQPLEMMQYRNLFSTSRLPRQGCDDLVHAPPASHVAVMARGWVYRVPVEGRDLAALRTELEGVLADARRRPPGPSSSFGVLTAAPREEWAATRARLLQDPANRAGVEMMEGALLLLCLDEESAPATLGDAMRLVRDGNLDNRWCDRSLQLVVFGNGRAGFSVEHSAVDGDPAARFGAALHARAAKLQVPRGPDGGAVELTRVDWKVDEPLMAALTRAHEHAGRMLHGREVLTERIPELGTASLGTRGHLGALIQIAIQLACAKTLGKLVTMVEPVQTRRFRGGRFDGFMVVTPQSKAFVEAALARPQAPELPGLLRAAMEAHFALLLRSKRGMGWHSHMSALASMDFPDDRVKGALGEEKKRAPLLKIDRGMAMLAKWEMNSGSVLGLPGVAAMGNVGVAPEMMAVGYIFKPDAMTVDVRADGRYRGHARALIQSMTESARWLDRMLRPAATAA